MLKSLVNLFFPPVCYVCLNHLMDNEKMICTGCRHSLPVTNFHFSGDVSVKKIFQGRAKIENATALFRFEKNGIVQKLIHNLKYKGYQNIGVFLGDWLGSELKTIAVYQTIDLVVPVPLHKKKLKKRGFNQVTKFGEQIAKALDVEFVDDSLLKITNTLSQTSKKRLARWQGNDDIFTLINTDKVKNKHILLVDDIITTGATVEACINVLEKANNVKISIATIAIA